MDNEKEKNPSNIHTEEPEGREKTLHQGNERNNSQDLLSEKVKY